MVWWPSARGVPILSQSAKAVLVIIILLIIQICGKTVSRTHMVQIPLEPSMSRDARKGSIFREFAFARSQRSKTFAKIRILAIYPNLCIIERRVIAHFKGLVLYNFTEYLFMTLTLKLTLKMRKYVIRIERLYLCTQRIEKFQILCVVIFFGLIWFFEKKSWAKCLLPVEPEVHVNIWFLKVQLYYFRFLF